MGIATHLGPWMLGTVKDNAGRNVGATLVTQTKAVAAADSLRVESNKLASRLASCNAGTAVERKARERAAMVFADLLRRADQRAGELAAAYDDARARGLTCELAYDAVRAGRQ